MLDSIDNQLNVIEKSLQWIQSSLEGEKRNSAYRQMVNNRRKLKKKKFAMEGNPAAAIYGESQVGKSYLVSSLLSEKGTVFGITDSSGKKYSFIEDINPQGGGSESTSLVSRFSIKYEPINEDFPIKAVLLSPIDLILILCDSYYNDIRIDSDKIIKEDEIRTEIEKLKGELRERTDIQNIIDEDDILEMEDYFKSHFSAKASNIIFSDFFQELSLIISKTKSYEWRGIFEFLWNKNVRFTELFNSLISEHERLDFADTIYLPITSVLREKGTLLDVARLKEIYNVAQRLEADYEADTKLIYIHEGNEQLITFSKPILCALTAELVFHQDKSLINTKPFLQETDLLDFPGARGRMTLNENEINNDNISQLLIRGKVAYLFNKYSEAEKINILLFCAKHEMAAQRAMPEMLEQWIHKFIGETPSKRENFISFSQVPPLFLIGTFFNVNLQYNPPESSDSMNYRWNQRFITTLEDELLDTKTKDWFKNWTPSKPNFQNIYLLRDFERSETLSQLFKGYREFKVEQEEIYTEEDPDFRKNLRESFINFEFVKNHFANPEEAWDEAASINKDGTELIIAKLSIAANNINKARREKAISDLTGIKKDILSEILKYYHSSDKDEELQKAKSIAGSIQHQMDKAFSADGIKNYGPLMQDLMLNESRVVELYRNQIDDINHRDILNLDRYSTYRLQVPVTEDDNAESYFDRLCTHYEKTTPEQKEEFRKKLDEDNIDLDELISGNTELIKNNAKQLAENLLDYWLIYINMEDKETLQQILANQGNPSLQEITDMYDKLFQKIGLADIIAGRIRHYVNRHTIADIPYEIISDISTELLNQCIKSVGFEFFDESEIHDLKEANAKNNLGLVIEDSAVESNGHPLEDLFERIENWTDIIVDNPEEMKSLPSYKNYLQWYNRLKVGFVSVCDIPNYDVNANKRLGEIINEAESINYE